MAGIASLASPTPGIACLKEFAVLTGKYVSGINAFGHFPTDNSNYQVSCQPLLNTVSYLNYFCQG